MVNPFAINQNVRPLGISRGAPVRLGWMKENRQAQAEEAKRIEQAQARQQMQQEFTLALESKNPDDMAKFSMRYPELAKTAQDAFGFTNDKTKATAQKAFSLAITAKDEKEAASYLLNGVKDLKAMGVEDTSNTMEAAQSLLNGEMSLLDLQKRVAVTDPDTWNSYQKFLDSQKSAEFQQGSGKMAGYNFNPETGEFKVNQQLMDKVDAAKAKGELDVKTRQAINKDFTALTKDTKLIRNTAKDLDMLSKIPSGPASIAMVFKFMKALDPTSVVRESEFATAENSSGTPEKVRNFYNKFVSGEKLGPNQIKEFVLAAKGLADSAITSSEVEIDSYLNTFEDTLTPGFKKSIRARIPKKFGIDVNQPLILQNVPASELQNLTTEQLQQLSNQGQ